MLDPWGYDGDGGDDGDDDGGDGDGGCLQLWVLNLDVWCLLDLVKVSQSVRLGPDDGGGGC